MMKPASFLSTLWRRVAKEGDYVFMSFKKGSKGDKGYKWVDECYQWSEFGSVLPWVSKMVKDYQGWDVYFCPTPFTKPKRQSQHVKPTNLLWSDIDDGDPDLLSPSVLWKSGSKGHTQGIWFLNKTISPIKTAQLNKGIAGFLGADPSGYDLSQVLRLPGTINYKTKVGRPVELVHWTEAKLNYSDVVKYADKSASISEYENHKVPPKLDRNLLLKRLNRRLKSKLEIDDCEDRSTQLFGLIPAIVNAGFTAEEIFWLLKGTYLGRHYKSDSKMIDDIHRTIKKTKANFKVKSKAKAKKEKTEDDGFESVASLVARDIPPPQWLVKGWLEFGPPAMVAGQAKAGKSTLLRELAVAVASGKPFMNNTSFEVHRPGTVLFIQEEDSEGKVRDDIIQVLKAKGCDNNIPLYFMNMKGFKFDEENMEKIEAAIEKYKPKLVIFDCLYRMIESGELNNADDMRAIQDWLSTLSSEYETTPLLAHHYGKTKESDRSALKMLGSSTWHNFFRSGVFVSKYEDTDEENVPDGCMKVFIERQFSNFGDIRSDFLIKLSPREYFAEGETSKADWKTMVDEAFGDNDSLKPEEIDMDIDDHTMHDVFKNLGMEFHFGRWWREWKLTTQTLKYYLMSQFIESNILKVKMSLVKNYFKCKPSEIRLIIGKDNDLNINEDGSIYLTKKYRERNR